MIDVILKIFIIRMTESEAKCEKKSRKYNYKNILLWFIYKRNGQSSTVMVTANFGVKLHGLKCWLHDKPVTSCK